MKMNKALLGVTILTAALVPMSAYAASGDVPNAKGTAIKVEATASVAAKPGTAIENTIGFAGGLPPSDILTQMIEQMKENAAKTGNDTGVVINQTSEGKEDKLTISLKDSTEDIVAKIQDKFKDAKPISASSIIEKKQGNRDSNGMTGFTASVAAKPGTAIENTIGFAGGLPPSDILTQMIEQMKENAAKTGNDTGVVINQTLEGKEDKLTISLKDSTEDIVAKIQDKFKDAKPISASSTTKHKK
ncbi:hypothetical protein [Paenibacillus marinisediminis]